MSVSGKLVGLADNTAIVLEDTPLFEMVIHFQNHPQFPSRLFLDIALADHRQCIPPSVNGLGSSTMVPGQKSLLSLVQVKEHPLSAIAVKESCDTESSAALSFDSWIT